MGDLLETCELAFCNELEITRPNLAMDIVHRHPTISQLIIKRLNHCEYLMDRSVTLMLKGIHFVVSAFLLVTVTFTEIL